MNDELNIDTTIYDEWYQQQLDAALQKGGTAKRRKQNRQLLLR